MSVFVIALLSLLVAPRAWAQAARHGGTFQIAGGSARFTDVAYSPVHDFYFVVWGNFGSVLGQLVRPDGSTLGGAFQIPQTTRYTHVPRVAWSPDVGSNGGFLVSWHDVVGNTGSIAGRLVEFSQNGSRTFVTNDFLIDPNRISAASVAAASIGYSTVEKEFLVTWHRGPNDDIVAQRVSRTGQLVGNTIMVTQDGFWSDAPGVDYNPNTNEYYVAYFWHNNGNPGMGNIRGQRINAATGALVGGPATLESGTGVLALPQVSYDSASNRYLVGWFKGAGGGDSLLCRWVNADGSFGNSFPIASGYVTFDGFGLIRNSISQTFFAVFYGPNQQGVAHENFGVEVGATGVPSVPFRVTVTSGNGNYNPRLHTSSAAAQWLVAVATSYSRVSGQFINTGPGGPSLSIADVSVDEGNTGTRTARFVVTLSQAASGPVTVDFTTSNGSATLGDGDYVANSGQVTFPAGTTTRNVDITVNGDTKVETDESFTVALSNASGASIADGSATGTIVSDDVPAPSITSISPNQGFTLGNSAVTIAGSNFGGGVGVKFGGVDATNVVRVNASTITARTPARANPGTVNVVVTNPDTQSDTLNGFTYVSPPPPPTVSGVAPGKGLTSGGTNITIAGTNFVNGAAVTLGGTAATNVVVVNATTITARTAARAAGKVAVVVTNPDDQSDSLANGFEYITPPPAPVVTSVTPSQGPTGGGLAVTVKGQNFADGAAVRFGDTTLANVVVVNETTITGTTAVRLAAGWVDVRVTNTDGQFGTLTRGFRYMVGGAVQPAPTVTQVSPNQGPIAGGTNVTITGTNFVNGATVSFGGTAATNVVRANGTTITARTPAHAAGFVDVVVTNPDTQADTANNGFQYVSGGGGGGGTPSPQAMIPNTGPTGGGTSFTISGSNFADGATVRIGGVAATNVVVVNSSTITGVTGARLAFGWVDVQVQNPNNQAGTLSRGFFYVVGPAAQPGPTVTTVQPAAGPPSGGTDVTITGTNFANGATVTFCGTSATNVVRVNGTTITARTPAHAAGSVAVVVTNPNSQSGGLNGFTYQSAPAGPPTITDISPAQGSTLGGTAITITGTNFTSGMTVTLGGVDATGVVVQDGSTIVAVSGPRFAAGRVDVVVRNTSNQVARSTAGYRYVAGGGIGPSSSGGPVTVTGVAPNSGSIAGGTNVTITGSGFAGGATVRIGGVPCTNVVVVNGTTITARTGARLAFGQVNVVVTNPGESPVTLNGGFTYTLP